jgi:hypothetical protein
VGWCNQNGCEPNDGVYYWWQYVIESYVSNGDMPMKKKLPWYACLLVAGFVGMG